MRGRLSMLAAPIALAFASCSDLRADEGRDAAFQVHAAQFRRGAMPADASGPNVQTATLSDKVEAGRNDHGAGGELDRSATALAVGLEGDTGYWTIRAAVPNIAAPSSPTFAFAYGLSASLAPGPRALVFRAVDGDGHYGPAAVRAIEVLPRARPSGRFVISLSWDTQVDLDLHVMLPNGVEIFKRNPAEYVPPPPSAGPTDPGAKHDGGVLDRDSNARCVLDGQRSENVVWNEPPPSGHYFVRVDTFAMCGGGATTWRVEATLDGVRIGGATGVATDTDLRFDHGRGSGVLALELDIP